MQVQAQDEAVKAQNEAAALRQQLHEAALAEREGLAGQCVRKIARQARCVCER